LVAQIPGARAYTIRDRIKDLGSYAGFGVQLGATVVVFFFLGYYLDRYLGTLPLFALLGTFIGAGASFYSIYRKLFPRKENGER
jgi:F0F1-type ATP synthase assembly protein I